LFHQRAQWEERTGAMVTLKSSFTWHTEAFAYNETTARQFANADPVEIFESDH
jgi:hypothetical protein